MKYSALYLHVGWSKTGTSAIQARIQQQRQCFLKAGLLYPQSLQWPDHSHHPFALAFNEVGGYQSELSPFQALGALRAEMESSEADSVLISSELSPFFFSDEDFRRFVGQYFETVKVIFTVRCQSELLLSLFNQLVKDPNVRYGGSLFSLAMRNLYRLNFYENIKRWESAVGRQNIHVIPYGRDVVEGFFDIFGLSVSGGGSTQIVNPSLPTRSLAVVQARGRNADGVKGFVRVRDSVLGLISEIPKEKDRFVLFSVDEQKAFDDLYRIDNEKLAEEFGFPASRLNKSNYTQITAIPPGMRLRGE